MSDDIRALFRGQMGLFHFPEEKEFSQLPDCEFPDGLAHPPTAGAEVDRWEAIGAASSSDYRANRGAAQAHFTLMEWTGNPQAHVVAICKGGPHKKQIYYDRQKTIDPLKHRAATEGPRARVSAALQGLDNAVSRVDEKRSRYLTLVRQIGELDSGKQADAPTLVLPFLQSTAVTAGLATLDFGILTPMGSDAALALQTRVFPTATLQAHTVSAVREMLRHPYRFPDLLAALREAGMSEDHITQLYSADKVLCEAGSNRFGRFGTLDLRKYAAVLLQAGAYLVARVHRVAVLVLGALLLDRAYRAVAPHRPLPKLSEADLARLAPELMAFRSTEGRYSQTPSQIQALLDDPQTTDTTLAWLEPQIVADFGRMRVDVERQELALKTKLHQASAHFASLIVPFLKKETALAIGDEALVHTLDQAQELYDKRVQRPWYQLFADRDLEAVHRAAPVVVGGAVGLALGFGAGTRIAHYGVYNHSFRPNMGAVEANYAALADGGRNLAAREIRNAVAAGTVGICDTPQASARIRQQLVERQAQLDKELERYRPAQISAEKRAAFAVGAVAAVTIGGLLLARRSAAPLVILERALVKLTPFL